MVSKKQLKKVEMSKNTGATSVQLFTDVITEIAQFCDNATLLQLALVSKEFYELSIPLIYHTLEIPINKALNNTKNVWKSIIDLFNLKGYNRYTRIIDLLYPNHLHIKFDEWSPEPYPPFKHLIDLRAPLSTLLDLPNIMLKRLKRLTVGFDRNGLLRLKLQTLPPLSHENLSYLHLIFGDLEHEGLSAEVEMFLDSIFAGSPNWKQQKAHSTRFVKVWPSSHI
jgi:hypothetical protein